MKYNELKQKSKAELQELLVKSRAELQAARFKDSNQQLANVRQIRVLRQEVARILTLINQSS
ncbi:MAG: 50S ribosomal protein L29 [bacterium]|nr:50S ribosomal protein L29 [bacterium]